MKELKQIKKKLGWPTERMDFVNLYFMTYMAGAIIVSITCLPNLGAVAGILVLFPLGLLNLSEKIMGNSILGFLLIVLYPILAKFGILTRSKFIYGLFCFVVLINIGGCFAGP